MRARQRVFAIALVLAVAGCSDFPKPTPSIVGSGTTFATASPAQTPAMTPTPTQSPSPTPRPRKVWKITDAVVGVSYVVRVDLWCGILTFPISFDGRQWLPTQRSLREIRKSEVSLFNPGGVGEDLGSIELASPNRVVYTTSLGYAISYRPLAPDEGPYDCY